MDNKTNTWEFISYDLWGNEEDGFEVNAAYHTGRVYEIDDESDDGIINFLRSAGFVDDDVDATDIDVDGDETIIYINYKGSPALEFRQTDTDANMGILH